VGSSLSVTCLGVPSAGAQVVPQTAPDVGAPVNDADAPDPDVILVGTTSYAYLTGSHIENVPAVPVESRRVDRPAAVRRFRRHGVPVLELERGRVVGTGHVWAALLFRIAPVTFRNGTPTVDAGEAPESYHLFARDGGVFAFGDAGFLGSTGALHLSASLVGGSSA